MGRTHLWLGPSHKNQYRGEGRGGWFTQADQTAALQVREAWVGVLPSADLECVLGQVSPPPWALAGCHLQREVAVGEVDTLGALEARRSTIVGVTLPAAPPPLCSCPGRGCACLGPGPWDAWRADGVAPSPQLLAALLLALALPTPLWVPLALTPRPPIDPSMESAGSCTEQLIQTCYLVSPSQVGLWGSEGCICTPLICGNSSLPSDRCHPCSEARPIHSGKWRPRRWSPGSVVSKEVVICTLSCDSRFSSSHHPRILHTPWGSNSLPQFEDPRLRAAASSWLRWSRDVLRCGAGSEACVFPVGPPSPLGGTGVSPGGQAAAVLTASGRPSEEVGWASCLFPPALSTGNPWVGTYL